MLTEIGHDLDQDNKDFRSARFSKSNYSVIFEGSDLEFYSLEKWLAQNDIANFEWTAYDKIEYNYFFFECFFLDENVRNVVIQIIPKIFTVGSQDKIWKTDGKNIIIECDASEILTDAIIVR